MRKPRIVVISDLHLGTYGAHAAELVNYLESINPEILILNGDIVDIWQFRKNYFPKEHFRVLQCLLTKVLNGTQVYYLTGNHDDLLRKFGNVSLGCFHMRDKLSLILDGKKYWIFHGDVFDSSIKHARRLARLGGKAYDNLIRLNRLINRVREKFNLGPQSFSKRIKANVKKAVQFIGDFEETAISLALENGYDYVICGHIHTPTIRTVQKGNEQMTYMNSGDWVENLTALEFTDDQWSIYDHLHPPNKVIPIKDVQTNQKLNAS